jgi:hypothetical protein
MSFAVNGNRADITPKQGRAAMSRSKSRTLRKFLIEGALLVLITFVPAVAGAVLLDHWYPGLCRNFKENSEDGATSTLGMPAGGARYMRWVELKPGSRAPELHVEALDGSAYFHLDHYRGVKPVVLVFGSLTCNLFQGELLHLEKLYQEYKDKVEFAFINIHEAGHEMEGFEYLLQGQEDREGHARCVRKAMRQVQLSLPGFNDSPDDAALKSYGAFPARLVIVDRDGRIANDFGRVIARNWDWPTIRKVLDEQYAHSTVALR